MADKKPEKKEKKSDKKPPAGTGGSAGNLGAEIIVAAIMAVILIPSFAFFFSPDLRAGFLASIATPFAYIKMAATIISMVGLSIAIYAYIRLQEVMAEEKKKLGQTLEWENERVEKNHRWERVEECMRSLNPSDWKVAILEADNILDDIVKRMGYDGATLGERMKTIEPSDFPYLEDAWRAHKTRNDIAHQAGAEYELTRAIAEQTINTYQRVFKETGYL